MGALSELDLRITFAAAVSLLKTSNQKLAVAHEGDLANLLRSTAFRWVQASWDNAGREFPCKGKLGQRG